MLLELKAERDPGKNRPGCRDAAGARGNVRGLPSAVQAPAPPWANAGCCKNPFRLLPELVQALLPLHSWKEATPAGGLEFFLLLM